MNAKIKFIALGLFICLNHYLQPIKYKNKQHIDN